MIARHFPDEMLFILSRFCQYFFPNFLTFSFSSALCYCSWNKNTSCGRLKTENSRNSSRAVQLTKLSGNEKSEEKNKKCQIPDHRQNTHRSWENIHMVVCMSERGGVIGWYM